MADTKNAKQIQLIKMVLGSIQDHAETLEDILDAVECKDKRQHYTLVQGIKDDAYILNGVLHKLERQ